MQFLQTCYNILVTKINLKNIFIVITSDFLTKLIYIYKEILGKEIEMSLSIVYSFKYEIFIYNDKIYYFIFPAS